MKPVNYDPKEFERTIKLNYDGMDVSPSELKILVKEYIEKVNSQINKLSSEKEIIRYLAGEKHINRTNKFEAKLCRKPQKSNGFCDLVTEWLSQNLEFHTTLNNLNSYSLNPIKIQPKLKAAESPDLKPSSSLELLDYNILHDELAEVYNGLVNSGLIKKDNRKTFDSIFSPKAKGCITWIGGQSSLNSFVKKLKPLLVEPSLLHVNATQVFVNSKSLPFKNIDRPGYPTPKKKELIIKNMISILSKHKSL